MSNPQIIIELTPSRIEVALLRPGLGSHQRAAEWRCTRLGHADWPTPFTTALPEVQTALAALLADAKITKARATVLYTTPGSVSLLTPVPRSVSTASAEQAALLALAGVADLPIDDSPRDTQLLHEDPANKAASRSDSEPQSAPQRHVLACADAEERTQALCDMLEELGLTVERLIPGDAVGIATVVRAAIDRSARGPTAAVVWLGEHSTSLAAAANGRLLFVRTISAGTEALVDALRRPLKVNDPSAPPISLDHVAARELLLAVGVPASDASIPGHPRLSGSALLPHLQPTLQRLSIEIKQSIRFGVSEMQRGDVRLEFIGPGGAVPNLAQTIARQTAVAQPEAVTVDAHADAADSSVGGLIAAFASDDRLGISLLPEQRRRIRSLTRVRKAMLIGAAAAAAFVTFEAVDAQLRLRQKRAALAAEVAKAQQQAPLLAQREQAAQANLALTGIEHRVRSALEKTVDWGVVLAALSRSTPPDIRLNALDMQTSETDSFVSVRGHVRFERSGDPPALIREYVNTLQQLPIVQNATLGATNRAAIGGHDAQVFELKLSLVRLPPRYLLPPISTAPTPPITQAPGTEGH